jgi:hypothetical protein
MRCTVGLIGLLACACAADVQSTAVPTHSELASAGLEAHDKTNHALRQLGLSQLYDVKMLNVVESKEMGQALREADITLGDRSKLRRFVEHISGAPEDPRTIDMEELKNSLHEDMTVLSSRAQMSTPCKGSASHVERHQLQEEMKPEESKPSSNLDTIAIVCTMATELEGS